MDTDKKDSSYEAGRSLEDRALESSSDGDTRDAGVANEARQPPKEERFGPKLWRLLKTPGSALQIVLSAAIAIGIGLAVTATTSDIPDAAPAVLEIPGSLWLRALRATVLPLIITAIILAVQNLKAMTGGGSKLAKWTVSYYVLTTIVAVVHSQILVALVWSRLMTVADPSTLNVDPADQELIEQRGQNEAYDIVVQVAESFIPQNIFTALAEEQLLAVLVSSIVLGCLIKGPESNSPLLRAIKEVDRIVFVIIEFLIKLAPIGVFFLILSSLLTLDISSIGQNLGVLIGSSIAGMLIHLFIILPIIFVAFTRENPYSWWLKHSPAWITAWGSASSAATLPVTMKCLGRNGVPSNIYKFTAPLGALINMDGTAIYFPIVVIFLAVTQGITLNAGDYTVIVLLAVLSSIATTPIPSSSLVLTVVIAGSVGIPITGMYALVVAIDWLIDRFRTALNVSSDIFAARIMAKVTGITDESPHDSHAQATLDRGTAEDQTMR